VHTRRLTLVYFRIGVYQNTNKVTIMKLYTKLLTLAAALGLLTMGTTSCTPEEAALGGALIGAGAAIAIMNSGHHGHGGHYGHRGSYYGNRGHYHYY
jgi:hypothetical protein